MGEAALADVNGYIHGSVVGYYEKYFQRKSWSNLAEEIIHRLNARCADGRWTNDSNFPFGSSFDEAFWKIQSTLPQGQGTWQVDPDQWFGSSEYGTSTRLSYVLLRDTNSKSDCCWGNTQIIGEFCENVSSNYIEVLSSLFARARKTFASQPTRLFLHGFSIIGSLMELWMFDRAGVYSCQPIDIQKEPNRFITIIAGYSQMVDAELGIMQFIKADKISKYMLFKGDHEATESRLYLEDQPIVAPEDIIGEGTTCYRAKRVGSNWWDFIVKLKWRLAKSRPEEQLLRLVRERSVSGIIQLFGQEDLASTGNLRQALQFGAYRELAPETVQSSSRVQGEATGKGQRDIKDVIKRGIVDHTVETEPFLDQDHLLFENRVLSCVVVFPPGRPLLEYKTILQLLEALRDAIKGHKSLYQKGKILHQDVSIENIIITEPENEMDTKGLMIDLDSAMELAVGPTRPGELIGTKPFMAIGLLKGRKHTYRHDLESFLYLFLWVAVCNRSTELAETSRLREWSLGSWWELSQKKSRDMRREHFETITSEFTQEFYGLKSLAENMRKILFPMRNGKLWVETDETVEAADRLYDGMIDVFDAAITQFTPAL